MTIVCYNIYLKPQQIYFLFPFRPLQIYFLFPVLGMTYSCRRSGGYLLQKICTLTLRFFSEVEHPHNLQYTFLQVEM